MNKNDKKTSYRSRKASQETMPVHEFKVYRETTLLDFLAFKMPNLSHNDLKSLLSHHQVSVDGVMVSQFDFPLYPEDMVSISKRGIRKKNVRDLPIIYEDEDLIVLDKPSGLLSVASDKERRKTAYRLVSDYWRAKCPKGRVFVVHRLDEDTSGVLVFAKNIETREALQKHWQEVVTRRSYYAIVEGKMEKEEDTFKDYLDQNKLNLVYVTNDRSKGKLAITSYRVMAYKAPYSLLDVEIDTGRKNQIRVQLGKRGHFVVGDDKYGEPSNPLNRLCLHAYQLNFTNPKSGQRYQFNSPMPSSFLVLMGKKKADKPVKEAPSPARDTRAATKIKVGKKRAQKKQFLGGKK